MTDVAKLNPAIHHGELWRGGLPLLIGEDQEGYAKQVGLPLEFVDEGAELVLAARHVMDDEETIQDNERRLAAASLLRQQADHSAQAFLVERRICREVSQQPGILSSE